QVISYMFKDPQVDITQDDNGNTIVKFSGEYRYAVGGDYTYSGYVSYSLDESGKMIMRKDGSDGIDLVIESIAVQLAT
ncbi:MAG: hypothetical protein IJ261_04455, partial [Clostridia bacterium]|nr:hypothetical protein [Clostridia bacterium]